MGSLNSHLPTLAEAAPEAFLEAVEEAVNRTESPFSRLYEQEGRGALGGTHYTTGLLWGLEGLAWEEEYLFRVTIALGDLAKLDPGGRSLNRPINSLRDIYLPWMPYTLAPIPKRIAAIKALSKQNPNVAWAVLLSLLPSHHQMSTGTYKPKWRNAIPVDWEKGVLETEYREQVLAYADMALEIAFKDNAKLISIVENIERLPKPSLDLVIERLLTENPEAFTNEWKGKLWSALTEVVVKHRKFPDAEWVLPPEVLSNFEEILVRFAPQDPRQIHARLFNHGSGQLYEDRGDWVKQEAIVQGARSNAIKEIFDAFNFEGVLEFVQEVKYPRFVGEALGLVDFDFDPYILPNMLSTSEPKLEEFLDGYIFGKYHRVREAWIDGIDYSNWSDDHISKFMALLPFKSQVWTRATRLLGPSEDKYWKMADRHLFADEPEIEFAISRLIDVGRPLAAIDAIYGVLFSNKVLFKDLAIRALLEGVSSEENLGEMNQHDTIEIIQALQNDPETDKKILFRIEWAYLPLIRHHHILPSLLEARLAAEPGFFCEVISLIYRPKDVDAEALTVTKEMQKVAENAYTLLDKWKTVPGTLEEGEFSEEKFKSWISEVKVLCAEAKRLEVALNHVGKVLIHAPVDPDGLWIHSAVAEELNAKDAEDMRNGYVNGKINARGAHFVDPQGRPEKELAKNWTEYADAVETAGYQRLAASLRGLARMYEREAERTILEHKNDDQVPPV